MNKAHLVKTWIEEELAMMRTEGLVEAQLLEPRTQGCVFANVLACHVNDFLRDRALVITLKRTFAQRGLTGEALFVTLFSLRLEMSKKEMQILNWLIEDGLEAELSQPILN